MRTLTRFVAPLLLLLLPGLALAWSLPAPQVSLGGGYALAVSTKSGMDAVGAYDLKNSQWLTGIGYEFLQVRDARGLRRFYASGQQLFNASEAGRGSFGIALGIPTGVLADQARHVARSIIPEARLPKWASTVGNWVSLEFGGGYRFLGTPNGVSPWSWTVGGRVKIPLADLRAIFKREGLQ